MRRPDSKQHSLKKISTESMLGKKATFCEVTKNKMGFSFKVMHLHKPKRQKFNVHFPNYSSGMDKYCLTFFSFSFFKSSVRSSIIFSLFLFDANEINFHKTSQNF